MAATAQANPPVEVASPAMRVRLVAWTQQPFAITVASARTCYAADFVFSGNLDRKGERSRTSLLAALPGHEAELAELGAFDTSHERRIELVAALQEVAADAATRQALPLFADLVRQRASSDAALARGIFEAGHHTPFQHPTFVFALENVSRNVVESFLHNHVFYNSEQQSQRYVEMKRAEVVVPAGVAADPEALQAFRRAVAAAWTAYHDLRERLIDGNERTMAAIGRLKGQDTREVRKEAEKKAQEWARYVIPIAAQTRLYHTVSGIVLLRYARMAEASGVGPEARAVVDGMLAEVRRVDPRFLEGMETSPRAAAAEGGGRATAVPAGIAPALAGRTPAGNAAASKPWGAWRHAEFLHATPDAHATVADALREVTGSSAPAAHLVGETLDPGRNAVWNDTLNTWDHSPELRTLRHVHLAFRKRLSLTAFAQDQRHRMTPASRPLLARALLEPDVYVPECIQRDPAARRVFDDAVAALWEGIRELKARGVADEDCAYLLPNATQVVFTQSGDLLGWAHKWRLRLCFNAQKEIFDASLEELRQSQQALPELTRFIGPPCSFVAAAAPPELQDSVEACCPEGPRWCGVKVWQNFDAAKGTPKRPY